MNSFNNMFELHKIHNSPASGDNDGYSGRILSEVGSFHLEYYDLAHASNDQKWLDRAFGIRDVLAKTKNIDGLYTNRISRPMQDKDGQWYAQEGEITFCSLVDSFQL